MDHFPRSPSKRRGRRSDFLIFPPPPPPLFCPKGVIPGTPPGYSTFINSLSLLFIHLNSVGDTGLNNFFLFPLMNVHRPLLNSVPGFLFYHLFFWRSWTRSPSPLDPVIGFPFWRPISSSPLQKKLFLVLLLVIFYFISGRNIPPRRAFSGMERL